VFWGLTVYLILFALFLAVVLLTSFKIFVIGLILCAAIFLFGMFGVNEVTDYLGNKFPDETVDGVIYEFDRINDLGEGVFRLSNSTKTYTVRRDEMVQRQKAQKNQALVSLFSLIGSLVMVMLIYALMRGSGD